MDSRMLGLQHAEQTSRSLCGRYAGILRFPGVCAVQEVRLQQSAAWLICLPKGTKMQVCPPPPSTAAVHQ